MSPVLYEKRERVAVLTLNRPDQRNAQNPPLLDELDACFTRAGDDEDVRVVVLNAAGKHFSAGHDISPEVLKYEPWSTMFDDVTRTGLMRMYNWECSHFLGYSRKWRDLHKPTIASVQGACIAAGLMLVWPMDIVIAADNARFSDPVVRMGVGGVEYHGHTWEFGARKAKELLFTAGFISAEEAKHIGMVNRVVPLEQLEAETMNLANEIAQMHPYALMMAKRAVNQTLDIQGQYAALQACFDIHSLGHANAWSTCGKPTTAGLAEMAPANKEKGA